MSGLQRVFQLRDGFPDVVALRGLGESGASETLARVAEALGISQTRVRQIEARALAKLRDTEPLRWLLADALEEEEEEEAGGDLRRPVGGGGSGGGGGVVEVGSR